jgi:cyclopropane-fatty-acyl-phospholipid synthase
VTAGADLELRILVAMDALTASRAITEELTRVAGGPAPRVRAWNGAEWGPVDAKFTLVLQHPGALRALLLPPSDLTAGEAYIYDDVDFDGDIFAALEFGAALIEAPRNRRATVRILRRLRKLPRSSRRSAAARPRMRGPLHSLRRDRQAVAHHYDTGNDFFSQFLDPQMVYSSAHFLTHVDTLETAQRRKMDLICRKLQLAPGDDFLDVGCGWGALVIHAVTEYGVNAVGVTVSGSQAEYARDWAREAGVGDRVTILQEDYRKVEGNFDAIASIGMFEHVGRKKLGVYFSTLARMLKPDGLILNHGIVTRDRNPGRKRPTFVSTYVFPDGELVPIDETIGVAEDAGLELRDVESLRGGYALTLRHWVTNLEVNRDEAIAATGEQVYRIWRLYMAASAVAFESAAISVYQLLLADPGRQWAFGRRRYLSADDQ